VDGLLPGPKEFEHWDDQLPGFGIRIKPTGVKTYVIRYRTPSGQRRLKLGRHGKLTPEQARNLAKVRFAEIEAEEIRPPLGRTTVPRRLCGSWRSVT
jgi:hypothetical protein